MNENAPHTAEEGIPYDPSEGPGLRWNTSWGYSIGLHL